MLAVVAGEEPMDPLQVQEVVVTAEEATPTRMRLLILVAVAVAVLRHLVPLQIILGARAVVEQLY